MGEIVARSEMTKSLMNGVGGVGAGIGLILVSGLIGHPIFWIAAGACAVIGGGMLASKTQKKAGAVLLGAGVIAGGVGLLSAILGTFIPWLIPVAGIGLIALGGFSIFKFFSNMKKRT